MMFEFGRRGKTISPRAGDGPDGRDLMLFSLLHNPCSTTITPSTETGGVRWTADAALLPLVLGSFGVYVPGRHAWRFLVGTWFDSAANFYHHTP